MREVQILLSTQLRRLGLTPEAGAVAQAMEFLSLLLKWNATINLVGTDDIETLVTRHLVDSMKVAKHMGMSCKLVDVGSGAGFPGLIVGLCRPDVNVTLVERTAKKAAFLQQAVDVLELSNIEIIAQNAEQVAEDLNRRFDQAVSRATFPPWRWLELARTLIKKGGVIWFMLGPRQDLQFVKDHTNLRVADRFEYQLADGRLRRLIGVTETSFT